MQRPERARRRHRRPSTTNFYTPIHSSAATNNKTIESFDANPPGGTTLNPGCITTKSVGPSFDRPNSTTAGIAALLDAVNGIGLGEHLGVVHRHPGQRHRPDRLRPGRPGTEDVG